MNFKIDLTGIIVGTALIFSGINAPATTQEVGQRMPKAFGESDKVFSRVWRSDDGIKIGRMDFYRLPKEGVNYEGRIFSLACEHAYITFSIYNGRSNEQFIDNMTTNKRGERVKESDGIIDELRPNRILYTHEDFPECPKN